MCYAAMVPALTQWATTHNIPLDMSAPTIESNCLYPLAFQPGTDWGYGTGYDWAGKVVEKVTGVNLDDYLQENICAAVGAKDMTFYLQRRPDMIVRRADIAARDAETGNMKFVDKHFFHEDAADCMGGWGVYGTPKDYLKVLYSILVNDGKLLKKSTRDMLFQPALSGQAEKRLNEKGFEMPEWRPHGLIPAETNKSHTPGAVICLENIDGDKWCREGSISWNGLTNHYWVCCFQN